MKNIFKFMLSLTIFLSCIASAAESETKNAFDFDKPLYAGIGFSVNDVTLIRGEKVESNIITRINVDDSSTGNIFIFGMHYGNSLDIETRYQNLGMYQQKVHIIDVPEQTQTNINTDLAYQSLGILMRPKYNLGKYFQVQAEVGLSYVMLNRSAKVAVLANKAPAEIAQLEADAKNDLSASSENKLGLSYGLSLLYQGNGYFNWRWAMDRHQHGDVDLASQSISIIKTFGGK